MSTKVMELAVVSIKEENRIKLQELQPELRLWLESQPGFISWMQTQSIEEPELIADILVWSDLESAKQASENMMNNEAGQKYSALMDEIKVFTHVKELS
jgi:heme-degrading monooxygenase HmoA